jgi:hypothetical protein
MKGIFMWFTVKLSMPYINDNDYKKSIIFDIESKLGNVPIDISSINYGLIDIDVPNLELLRNLNTNFFTGEIINSYDREIMDETQRTILNYPIKHN